jgi:apolipoprotein N-acyltransferase
MIDPYGRILAEIGLGEKGAIDSELPKAVPQTLFAQLGLVIEISMIGLAFACWLVLRVQPIGASY